MYDISQNYNIKVNFSTALETKLAKCHLFSLPQIYLEDFLIFVKCMPGKI